MASKPKALLVTSSFLPGKGGIESYLAELCEQVAPSLAVMAQGKRGDLMLPTDLGYPTFALPSSVLWPSRRNLQAIIKVARQLGTDKVFFGTPWPMSLHGPGLKQAGLRYIVLAHAAEVLIPFRIPLLGMHLAQAISGADLLFTVSNFTAGTIKRELAARNLPVPDITRLPPRVDLQTFSPSAKSDAFKTSLSIPTDSKVIIFVSRLVQRKGAGRLIKALPNIRKHVPNAYVVIVGNGPETPALQRLAAKTPGAIMAGSLPNDKTPSAYASSDIFALPVVDGLLGLETEGLGIVILEAQACGIPVISGVSGGTVEALVDQETGFLIDARSQNQLVERIVWLLTHESERLAIGQAGRRFIKREFAHDLPPQQLLDWLNS